MSNVRFVVFHVGPESLDKYKPLMEVGRDALNVTNPGAAYVVLTDKETAPHLDKEFEVEVLAPSDMPLMWQYVAAQTAYEIKAQPGLTVLAGTDCVANRDLSGALKHNMAVTYRMRGRSHINNVAYVEDHDRAAWFLNRALGLMSPKLYDFFGDMQAWEAALGPFETWDKVNPEDKDDCIRIAKPEGRWIHLYPCRTHNYFSKTTGVASEGSQKAYVIHFKGNAKKSMVQAVRYYILGDKEASRPLKKNEIYRSKGLPPREKRCGTVRMPQ